MIWQEECKEVPKEKLKTGSSVNMVSLNGLKESPDK
jgi:hypothetical protein